MKKMIIISLVIFTAFVLTAQIFAELGATPDSEKTHTVIDKDTLANISYKYYTNDDRERGAHWIHIYEYSIDKKLINPKTQPIVPYGKTDARVKIFVDKKVAIPFFKGQYPSANALLNEYGFELGTDGVSVEKIDKDDDKKDEIDVETGDVNTNLPINIGVDSEAEEEAEEDNTPFWVGQYQANADNYIENLKEKQKEKLAELEKILEQYEISLNEDMTLTATMGDDVKHGSITENEDGTLTLALPTANEDGTEEMLEIKVTPEKIGDNVYFIYDSGKIKLTFISQNNIDMFEEKSYLADFVLSEWVGEYEADIEAYIEQIKDRYTEEEIAIIKSTVIGYTLTLRDNYELITNLGGEFQKGKIKVENNDTLALLLEDGNVLSVKLVQEGEEKSLIIKDEDGNITFNKIG